jgi:hypothetical protein
MAVDRLPIDPQAGVGFAAVIRKLSSWVSKDNHLIFKILAPISTSSAKLLHP